MGKAYQGMSGTQEEIVNRSVEIYADHLPPKQQPTAKAKGATEDVHYAFGRVADNSAGPDMWRPRELRCLGPIYCGWIAEIINMAEDGLGWPEDLECATIAYISKEPTPNVRDMLKYKVITIPPSIYRVRARTRYRRTADWAEQWADEGQHSSRKGR